MEVSTLLVADYANTAEGGKPNVMGIFRMIYSEAFPARQAEMYLVAVLTAGPAEFGKKRIVTIKLINDDATATLVEWTQPIEIKAAPSGHKSELNCILRLRDVIFPAPGTYQFSVLVDDDEKGTLSIEVNKIEVPQIK